MFLKHRGKPRKVFRRRYDVTAGGLNGFDIKSGVFNLVVLGIDNAIILRLEKFFKLLYAIRTRRWRGLSGRIRRRTLPSASRLATA